MAREALEGLTQHDVLPREVADNHLARGREVLTRQELVYFEDEIAGRYFQNYLVPVPASKHKGTFQIISRDITQNKQLQEYLRCMSYYDALTGLYNRNFFHEEMNRLKDGRYIPLGILICDINGLKRVNDTLGHEKGDELIQATGEILKSCFRESDILARIGGDEFAILLPHSDEDALRHARGRIISHVERYNSQARINDLSLSIGYAVEERQPPDLHDMFKRADDAMYQEKHKSVYSRC
jgi:diguanylate cyclase (GGDEF)-like protein